ncbi:uncharacterized protein G2W53_016063 [Senna tora]|uniref:Uncharacterized protein n=1 Tax=Senna tora TaxID=362788 RepID=A0A835C8R2_9FABA|nr:uncharacterized protein G2W53_016063 [Senna tora]
MATTKATEAEVGTGSKRGEAKNENGDLIKAAAKVLGNQEWGVGFSMQSGDGEWFECGGEEDEGDKLDREILSMLR